MAKLSRKHTQKAGLPPGSLVYVGDEKTGAVKISVVEYDRETLESREIKKIEDLSGYHARPTVTWVMVEGIHDAPLVEKIGKIFNFHPILMEAVLETWQRPKIEEFKDYVFLAAKKLYFNPGTEDIESGQIAVFFGEGYVVTFSETAEELFSILKNRIEKGIGMIRHMKSDFLVYELLDAIVDNYYVSLESMAEKIDELEEKLVSDPSREILSSIRNLKNVMIFLRKITWPLRELINKLERIPPPLVEESTRVYLRDVYEHTFQIVDAIETYQDVVTGMLDIYLSSISNKLNEIMKVLTVISTIFIPLNFIAGVYGMNFKYMPELRSYYGYPAVLLIMAMVVAGMLLYFRKRKWF